MPLQTMPKEVQVHLNGQTRTTNSPGRNHLVSFFPSFYVTTTTPYPFSFSLANKHSFLLAVMDLMVSNPLWHDLTFHPYLWEEELPFARTHWPLPSRHTHGHYLSQSFFFWISTTTFLNLKTRSHDLNQSCARLAS